MIKRGNNRLLSLVSVGVFLLLSFISYFVLPPFIKNNGQIRLRVGEIEFRIEVANNNVTRTKGLSGRESLGENEGMLFIFEKPDTHSFWMKGMNFPLDIIWISDGQVVEISENLPPAALPNLTVYSPHQPVNMVLEVNAGAARDKGIKAGDSIELLDGDTQILYY